jgi:hypothetical protein
MDEKGMIDLLWGRIPCLPEHKSAGGDFEDMAGSLLLSAGLCPNHQFLSGNSSTTGQYRSAFGVKI